MSIDFDKFLLWAESRFDGDVVVSGNEIKLNSIFTEDYKHHLWCNCEGGINEVPYGVYHCWKTDKYGTLINLIMEVDCCSFKEALDTLDIGDANSLEIFELEKKINELFENKYFEKKEEKNNVVKIPEYTYDILSLDEDDYYRMESVIYLNSRKIPLGNLMVCKDGKYKNRIIIPYYNKEKELIFFNSRYYGNNKKILRYLFPSKEEFNVGKSEVVFMYNWPEKGKDIYLTEGEFDAISLSLCGLDGCAIGGKFLSEKQFELIKDYKINICFDNDKSGKEALIQIGNFLINNGFYGKINYASPPKGYKDWNNLLIKKDNKKIYNFVKSNLKRYDDFIDIQSKLNSI